MKLSRRIISLLTAAALLSGCAAAKHGSPTNPQPKPALAAPASVASVVRTPTTEGNITRVTTSILERSQFSHHPLSDDLAGKFLDGYLDALDGTRSLFLAEDVAEFSRYRATLAQATRASGDTSVARLLFARYLERLAQQAAFANQLLKDGQFDFTGHDAYSLDREHAQRPLDLNAAQALWRQQLRAAYLQEKLTGATPEKISATLTRRYDERLATMRGFKESEVLEIYLNALAHVYDPHSDYLGHEEMENLSISMNLALFGIGATLENVDGYCEIRGLVPGGPAATSGLLKPGDRIVGVAQLGKPLVEIKDMPLSRTVELIRGPKGTSVTLSILPGGSPEGTEPKPVLLVRDEIKLEDQQASARIVDLSDKKGKKSRLGVIDLPSFYANLGEEKTSEPRSVTKDVARLLGKLKAEHVKGILLDLRRNGGGSLNEAVSLTGLFIHRGPVVQTRDPNGAIELGVDRDPNELYEGPLVVLTSRFSASASEILAGALQDYGRALVVGDSSTFGKGTVQSVLPLARIMDEAKLSYAYDPGALKVTIEKFYRPDGASTQLKGVLSDIVLPSTSDFSDVSESALKNPLPWDQIPPTPHERSNWVTPYVARLRQASAARVASNASFSRLNDDIARMRQDLAAKSISLNEAERRADMDRSQSRQTLREEESKKLSSAAPTAYDITLQNVDRPGLPPATPLSENAKTSSTEPPSKKQGLENRKALLSSADDILLNEAVHILDDYVNLAPQP